MDSEGLAGPVPEVDVATAAARADGGTPLIDVRKPEEYAEVHAAGARLVPLDDLADRVDEVPSDGPVLVICRSGQRSLAAATFLRAQGIDAINVAGGTLAWVEAELPSRPGDTP